MSNKENTAKNTKLDGLSKPSNNLDEFIPTYPAALVNSTNCQLIIW